MAFSRVVWIVLDSVGIGELPDAAAYGDVGSNTLCNLDRVRPLHLPHLQGLGLANIAPFPNLLAVPSPQAAFGRCALASPGKDTTTGHWEMAGIHLEKPFPLFPQGFPPEIVQPFEQRIGRTILGNTAASGTEIIEQLGEKHVQTGSPIVYTSADSVFQIAAHEDVIPVWELYRMCEIARGLLRGPYEVGRVIARPFTGEEGEFVRSPSRKDYAVPPPKGMLLDQLLERGLPVWAVGKIVDVFLGRGIGEYDKTKNNAEGMEKTLAAMAELERGLLFVNLVDFDQQYGHRNDVEGYAQALELVDAWLPECLAALREDDLLVLTADHGCDPTTPGTDHTREYVPLLATGPRVKPGVALGTRATLSDIGQTVAACFGGQLVVGTSFLPELLA